MKEVDAKQKRCHKSMANGLSLNCLGSYCMAWQWDTELKSVDGCYKRVDSEEEGYCAALCME